MTQSLAAYLVDDTTLMSIAFAPEVFESKMTLDNYQLKTEEGQELSKKVKAKEKCKPTGNHHNKSIHTMRVPLFLY